MAIDATGTPTSLGIPKFNTAVDAPSGKGSNAQMDAIDLLIASTPQKPAGIVTGEAMVYNTGAGVFQRSSVTKLASGNFGPVINSDIDAAAAIAVTKLAAGSNGDVLTTTGGVPGWAAPTAAGVAIYDRGAAVDVANTAAETSLYSKSITGGDLSTNKKLRLELLGDILFNNATTNTLTLRVKFGGTTFIVIASNALGTLGVQRMPFRCIVEVANVGSNSVQHIQMELARTAASGGATLGSWNAASTGSGQTAAGQADTTVAYNDGAINTANAQTLDVTAQWSAASANNSVRARSAILELI
jgi:hypothetical protein